MGKFDLGTDTKKCRKCKLIKNTKDDFHKNSNTYDGKSSKCKECAKTYSKHYWLNTKGSQDKP